MADTHFASQIILLLGTLYFIVAWYTLLPNSLCSSTHFTPQHILLPGILFSSAHFASWNTLLPRTLCFLCSREQSMLRRRFYKGAKCSREESLPRSREFQEAKCDGEQSVSGSKVFQGSKCVEEQSVLWSKVCVSPSNMMSAGNTYFVSKI